MSEPKQVETLEEFESIIKEKNLVIVDFFATWCPPCKFISPIFDKMMSDFPEVTFLKVDVDKSKSICKKYSIECMPTFITFANGKLKEKISGANEGKLKKTLQKLTGKVIPPPEGEVDTLEEFEKTLRENEKVIVDCFAEWCGPCQMISPLFKEMKSKYPGIKFIKSNADEAEDIYRKLKVNCMPTFITFRKGVEEERMEGANPGKLLEIINELNGAEVVPVTIKGHEHPMKEKNLEGFICEICYFEKKEKTKAFHCNKCKTYICGDCKEKLERNLPIKKNKDVFMAPKAHKHVLFRIKRPCGCDLCRKSLQESYCCEKCDFDLCDDCFKKNQ